MKLLTKCITRFVRIIIIIIIIIIACRPSSCSQEVHIFRHHTAPTRQQHLIFTAHVVSSGQAVVSTSMRPVNRGIQLTRQLSGALSSLPSPEGGGRGGRGETAAAPAPSAPPMPPAEEGVDEEHGGSTLEVLRLIARLRSIAEGLERTDESNDGIDLESGCQAVAKILDDLIREVRSLPAEELMAQESLKVGPMTALFKQLQAKLPSRAEAFFGWNSYEAAVRPKALGLMKVIFDKFQEAGITPPRLVAEGLSAENYEMMRRQPSGRL